ncbi:MAG: BrnA antitoxin family protein [Terriglobales bacterium]
MSRNSTKKRSKTNWKRVDALPDTEINFSEIPELGPGFFRHAIRWPGRKEQITLRLDPDVLSFFRQRGQGYQTTINAVLRCYMEAQQHTNIGR